MQRQRERRERSRAEIVIWFVALCAVWFCPLLFALLQGEEVGETGRHRFWSDGILCTRRWYTPRAIHVLCFALLCFALALCMKLQSEKNHSIAYVGCVCVCAGDLSVARPYQLVICTVTCMLHSALSAFFFGFVASNSICVLTDVCVHSL